MNQRNNKMESEIREVHVKMSKKIAQLTKGQDYFHTYFTWNYKSQKFHIISDI